MKTKIKFKKHSLKKTIKKCSECGILFRPTRKEHKYCSVKCGSIASRKRRGQYLIIQCYYCKKKLHLKRYHFQKYKKHYCSKKCFRLSRKRLYEGKSNPNWKKGGMRKCRYCNKEYKRYNQGSRYCSFKCYSLAVKGRSLTPYYKSGRRYEYKTIRELKKIGFQIVIRSTRSQGIFDIFAIRGSNKTRRVEEVRCIQVKSTASNFPVKSIVPKNEREEISNNKEVPIIGRNIFYEIWIWRVRKGRDIYRLNWKTREFDKI